MACDGTHQLSEGYPDVREIKTELQCNNQKLLWTFDLLDIYPIATCTFHTEDENGTLEGRTHNSSGSLFSSEYRLNCTLQDGNCKGVIHVLCYIDDKIIDINNRTYDCCKDFKRNAEKDDVTSSIIPVVLVTTCTCIVVAFVVVGIRWFLKGKVIRQKILRNNNEALVMETEHKLLDQNNSEQVINKKVDPVNGSDESLKVQIDSQNVDYGTTE
ncbi:uncharacterized protein LOC143076227 isoform X2 [Mytilus galloprovincialis]|uniref:uncharacterized protein LOC143076227 isoform X2 n=1 Tax=Mytilus galloprovincialis TaxID=29158 RepID=UPI003F7B3E90